MNAANVIMVVEDDQELRESVCELLEESGYRPLGMASGAAALAHLEGRQPKPEVILLDLTMPGMNGREFREAQLRNPALSSIPVVVMTASRELGGVAADDIIYKPLELDRLLDVVQRYSAREKGRTSPTQNSGHNDQTTGSAMTSVANEGGDPVSSRSRAVRGDPPPGQAWSDPAVPALGQPFPVPPPIEGKPDVSGSRILLVDDDEGVRRYVRRLLERSFRQVETAENGAVALAMARANPPDLILSDVIMPGLDGIALVQQLRGEERTKQVPIILLSARAGEESTVEALAAGADDYLVKPFSARELLARLGVHLRMAHVRQQAAEHHAAGIALRRLMAEKDEFISLASHEFRTPLTTIGLQAEGLLRGLSQPDCAPDNVSRLRKRAEMVKQSTYRLEAIIEGLLNVLALKDGQPPAINEHTDLVQVSRDVVRRFEDMATRAGSTLSLRTDASLVGAWSRKALEQIVSNLLSNAIKFGCGRAIEVSVLAEPSRARIIVHDEGIGVDAANHERIFQRFGRAVSETNYSGLGLGLWVVRNLAEAMGGSVRVESSLGRGATFTVELPREGRHAN